MKSKPHRTQSMISVPIEFWNAIDNIIDGRLINSRGDAIIALLLEMQQVKPGIVKFDEMITIKLNEYHKMKTELMQLQVSKPGARKWLTEANLALIEAGLQLTPDSSEQMVMIALDGIKIEKSLHEKFKAMHSENIALKKRIAELEAMQVAQEQP